jgi:hypothetical protein
MRPPPHPNKGTSPAPRRWVERPDGLSNSSDEGIMAGKQDRQIVETPTEARQGEPGPSVLALLTVSIGLAVMILGVIWFVFFRT